jgi:hypothetical protein
MGSQVKPTTDARRCHRCHAIGHIARNCPAPQPFAGEGMLRPQTDPFGVQWMGDSGCSHDMHSGGGLRAGAFRNYRRFEQPVQVHFGKRGTLAPALGVGEMVLRGCAGLVVLASGLHVPDLVDPLFSVTAALRRGMSVHFCPPAQAGGKDDVPILQNGELAFTARAKGDLYYLNVSPCAASASVPATVRQLADPRMGVPS